MRVSAAPPAADGRLNLIVIVADTWGAHFMGCYGNTEVRTPNLDRLAAKSFIFADAYAEALPTIPARRAIYTGRRIFPSLKVAQELDLDQLRGWHQLYVEDVTLSETLFPSGMMTALISDCYHQFKPDKNFHRGFYGWRPIRGQEADMYETGPRGATRLTDYLHPSQYAAYMAPGLFRFAMVQYMTNRRTWQSDEDRPTSRLFADASNWLDNNTLEGIPFYLHVETYSPHEFWDPPEEFYRPYMKSDYSGPRLIFPPAVTTNLSPVEIEHARALYYGMVSFVDDRLGRLMSKLDELDLWQNTVVALTADHGTMLGEQGQFHKDEGRMRTQVTRVPLIVYHPRMQPRRIKGYVQHTDIMPTLLQILGVDAPARVTGRSLVPYMQSGDSVPGDRIVTGWADHGAIRTPEWLYQGRWNPGDAYEELYDLRKDPLELNNVNQQNPALIEDFRKQLKDYVDAGWETTRGTFAKPEEDRF